MKQNFELTLIIIFIGLAFGLVGLIVQTAAVMSIVVISVGVIVGFVSYRDAFIPRPNGESAVNAQVVNTQVPQTLPAPFVTVKPEPRPQQVAPRPQQIAPISRQIEEPLPRLPRIQRITSSDEPTFSSPIKTAKEPTRQVTAPLPPMTSQSSQAQTSQDRLTKSRKARARKTVEVPRDYEANKD